MVDATAGSIPEPIAHGCVLALGRRKRTFCPYDRSAQSETSAEPSKRWLAGLSFERVPLH